MKNGGIIMTKISFKKYKVFIFLIVIILTLILINIFKITKYFFDNHAESKTIYSLSEGIDFKDSLEADEEKLFYLPVNKEGVNYAISLSCAAESISNLSYEIYDTNETQISFSSEKYDSISMTKTLKFKSNESGNFLFSIRNSNSWKTSISIKFLEENSNKNSEKSSKNDSKNSGKNSKNNTNHSDPISEDKKKNSNQNSTSKNTSSKNSSSKNIGSNNADNKNTSGKNTGNNTTNTSNITSQTIAPVTTKTPKIQTISNPTAKPKTQTISNPTAKPKTQTKSNPTAKPKDQPKSDTKTNKQDNLTKNSSNEKEKKPNFFKENFYVFNKSDEPYDLPLFEKSDSFYIFISERNTLCEKFASSSNDDLADYVHVVDIENNAEETYLIYNSNLKNYTSDITNMNITSFTADDEITFKTNRCGFVIVTITNEKEILDSCIIKIVE